MSALYEEVRSIGSGSFGEVFLVQHKKEKKNYVMKKIKLHAMNTKERQATEQEVALLASFSHPCIVGFKDSFLEGSSSHQVLNIVMEYCEHGDMYGALKKRKDAGRQGFPEGKVLDWLIQLILGLHFLHERRILHRDMKTQNVFLTRGQNQANSSLQGEKKKVFAVKLGDFGVARVLDGSRELAMTQIGTPFYMSPELFKSRPYSFKSDVWALGCCLYEMLCGSHAFDAQSINALAFKVLKGKWTPIPVAVSRETKDLLKAMLATNPKYRPTLREILHSPQMIRRIPSVIKTILSCASEESAPSAHQTLLSQLSRLGLSDAVPGVSSHIHGDPLDSNPQQHHQLMDGSPTGGGGGGMSAELALQDKSRRVTLELLTKRMRSKELQLQSLQQRAENLRKRRQSAHRGGRATELKEGQPDVPRRSCGCERHQSRRRLLEEDEEDAHALAAGSRSRFRSPKKMEMQQRDQREREEELDRQETELALREAASDLEEVREKLRQLENLNAQLAVREGDGQALTTQRERERRHVKGSTRGMRNSKMSSYYNGRNSHRHNNNNNNHAASLTQCSCCMQWNEAARGADGSTRQDFNPQGCQCRYKCGKERVEMRRQKREERRLRVFEEEADRIRRENLARIQASKLKVGFNNSEQVRFATGLGNSWVISPFAEKERERHWRPLGKDGEGVDEMEAQAEWDRRVKELKRNLADRVGEMDRESPRMHSPSLSPRGSGGDRERERNSLGGGSPRRSERGGREEDHSLSVSPNKNRSSHIHSHSHSHHQTAPEGIGVSPSHSHSHSPMMHRPQKRRLPIPDGQAHHARPSGRAVGRGSSVSVSVSPVKNPGGGRAGRFRGGGHRERDRRTFIQGERDSNRVHWEGREQIQSPASTVFDARLRGDRDGMALPSDPRLLDGGPASRSDGWRSLEKSRQKRGRERGGGGGHLRRVGEREERNKGGGRGVYRKGAGDRRSSLEREEDAEYARMIAGWSESEKEREGGRGRGRHRDEEEDGLSNVTDSLDEKDRDADPATRCALVRIQRQIEETQQALYRHQMAVDFLSHQLTAGNGGSGWRGDREKERGGTGFKSPSAHGLSPKHAHAASRLPPLPAAAASASPLSLSPVSRSPMRLSCRHPRPIPEDQVFAESELEGHAENFIQDPMGEEEEGPSLQECGCHQPVPIIPLQDNRMVGPKEELGPESAAVTEEAPGTRARKEEEEDDNDSNGEEIGIQGRDRETEGDSEAMGGGGTERERGGRDFQQEPPSFTSPPLLSFAPTQPHPASPHNHSSSASSSSSAPLPEFPPLLRQQMTKMRNACVAGLGRDAFDVSMRFLHRVRQEALIKARDSSLAGGRGGEQFASLAALSKSGFSSAGPAFHSGPASPSFAGGGGGQGEEGGERKRLSTPPLPDGLVRDEGEVDETVVKSELEGLLGGPEKIGYYSMLHQLVFFEEALTLYRNEKQVRRAQGQGGQKTNAGR
uniref:non-specific serine/threonine protein kinase n=1 Tax=Chromera velia CCMP2878 TaxID=1169474 RepID=A0A0G4F7S1_9ALVE|eukprot:Cvel_15508.t1-p1 / transcript=Cvel_15508.t1 / gene=Cvel_15508 / organism=Chromera_velia_CCMP2878 / gene_product=Serine/threonine-protein kinase Nek4, putative / transcript_product=Serine/threonine-protein kinase Nek4, putative / location=Cvel_scaffold1151:30728-40458(-) / protein_length=1466 / sequence_SO=supercontig / SO=protein_coding / is_pseudo=false